MIPLILFLALQSQTYTTVTLTEICVDMHKDFACVRRYGTVLQGMEAWIEEQHREWVFNNLTVKSCLETGDCTLVPGSHAVSTTPRHRRKVKGKKVDPFLSNPCKRFKKEFNCVNLNDPKYDPPKDHPVYEQRMPK